MKRRIALGVVLGLALAVGLANAVVLLGGRGAAPAHAQAAVVPGALVYPDGRLSGMLADRVDAAARLYREGRVDKILVSGDHHTVTYDEVTPMRKRLLADGVPARDIFEDHAGFDTWSTMVRARKVFGLDNAIVVTQNFHLARAVWLARRAGLDASGIAADRPEGYGRQGQESDVREVLARVKAIGSGLLQPRPKYLGPSISMSGDGRVTWGPVDRDGPS
jgi:SanA protein